MSYDDGWIPGWSHAPSLVREGMWYDAGYPPRITLHTIEGNLNVGSAVNHRYTPQVWVSWRRRQIVQTLPLIYAGYATWGGGDPYDTRTVNGHVQVEIEGSAADSASIPRDALDWMASDLIVPIMRFYAAKGWGFNVLNTPDTANEVMGGSAAENAPQRMDVWQWAHHDGINGHRHVVWNGQRWDPGPLDTLYIARTAYDLYNDSAQPGADAMTPAQEDFFRRKLDYMQELEWAIINETRAREGAILDILRALPPRDSMDHGGADNALAKLRNAEAKVDDLRNRAPSWPGPS